MKENDIILNMLANPEFTITDFQSVGLNGENTGLRSEEEYKKSEKITTNKNFLDENGKFDEAKFHKFYVGAGQFYNQLTTQNYEKALMDQTQFSQDNIWVSPEKRTIDYSPKLVRQQNEHLVTSSLNRIGKKGERTLSQSEIAQTQKIYNTNTGKWEESPNESFFDKFFDTLVLATYDEDVYDKDGKLIHQKGERKLNDEGLPYYETLGGRDVYGKQVLNKFNMLTTDGSALNQYDFFDTDDLEQKSVGGTIIRNAALVGSMFIPYVGPWIAGLSVATQMAGLTASFGKLFTGNDNELLNEIQGWAKTVDRHGQTEYAAQNTWSTENVLNMIGDTIGQLKEQRWIFKTIPAVLGHKQAYQAMSGKYEKVVSDVEKTLAKDKMQQTTKNLLQSVTNPKHIAELEGISQSFAQINRQNAINYVDDLMKAANEASAPIARAYMVGLVVQDTYGEAKAAGASDLEAALLTMGYAAMENKLLKTELGNWIMPELKSDRLKHKAIARALTSDVKDAYGKYAQDNSKKGFVQKLLNIGKDIRNGKYSEKALLGLDTAQVVAANATTEMVEEVSEEILADVSKSLFNVTRWLRGEDSLELGEWDNMFDRYAMSALGGFLGGGIASAGTDFKQARDLSNMDKTKAMQEILYMVNNNKEADFIKSLNKMTLGNKNLSAKNIINISEQGDVTYGEGTAEDNQDLAIKNLVKKQINLVRDILNSEGAKISQKSLLNKLTLEDQQDILKHVRYVGLQNSTSMGLYLQDYANIQSQIVSTKAKLMKLSQQNTDSQEENLLQEDERKRLEKTLDELRVKKDAYLNGTIAPEAIRDSILELNPELISFLTKTNLKMWAEAKLGKKWGEMSDSERKDITEKYKVYKSTDMKNDIHTAATIYQNMLELFTPTATQAQDFVNKLKTDGKTYSKVLSQINTLLQHRSENYSDQDVYMENLQKLVNAITIAQSTTIGAQFISQQTQDQLNQLKQQILNESDPKVKENLEVYYETTLFTSILNSLDQEMEQFYKLKYIHPEVKNQLKLVLQKANSTIGTITGYEIAKLEESYDPDAYDKINDVMQNSIQQQEKVEQHLKKLDKLSNTPIVQYLNQFQVSTTNSNINLTKHLETIIQYFEDSKDDLGEIFLDPEWQETNEEALLLLDSFIAVMQGLKVDNADILNPTGYSKILNEVYTRQGIKNYVPLAELDSETVDMMVQDALVIKNRLEFMQDLHALNQGQKLKQQNIVAVNKDLLLYKKLKDFVSICVPDDWVSDEQGVSAKQKLEQLLNNSSLAQVTNLRISKEQRTKINAEMVILGDALYNIFEINKKNGSWDKEKLKYMIRKLGLGGAFFQKTGNILNENTTALDTNSFIWWLAAKAALKTSSFNSAYEKSLTDDLAPIPSQELAVQLGVAAITNMDVLNTFVEAYQETIVEEFNDASEQDKIKYLEQYDGGTSFAKDLLQYFASYNAVPQFKNMVFIEGIPGSGKSGGVFRSIKNVLDQIDPSIWENAIYAHATQISAEKATKDLGLNNVKAFDKTALMQYISSEWRDVLKNPKNKDNEIYLYDDSFEFINGHLVNKWKLNTVSDPPKVIFIDEVSHYNQQELSMIEQFAKINGIVVLTAGDLQQNSLVSYFIDTKMGKMNVSIDRNHFIRTPKLGVSMRSRNRQMTYSVSSLQAAINQYEQKNDIEPRFMYFEGDINHKGLYGVRSETALNEDVKKTIQLMVDTAQDNIGYMYQDENSDVLKYLRDTYGDKVITYEDYKQHPEYKDKIILFKGSEAQGLEGQYYIIEPVQPEVGSPNKLPYLQSLYTGISRAEQGALVISTLGAIANTKDNTFQLETLSEEDIKKASNQRKQELIELNAKFPGEAIKITPPTKQNTINSNPNPTPFPPPPPPPVQPVVNSTTEDQAKEEIQILENNLSGLNNPKFVRNQDGKEFEYVKGEPKEINGNWIPMITLKSDSETLELALENINKEFQIKDTSGNVVPLYKKGDKIVIEENGVKSEIIITDINAGTPIEYQIQNIDGTNPRTLTQEALQAAFKEFYQEPIQNHEDEDPYVEVTQEPNEYEPAVAEINSTELDVDKDELYDNTLYTFSGFETGISFDGNVIKYDGKFFDERRDNAIGLMHLKGWNINDPNNNEARYNQLIRDLGNIKRNLQFKSNADFLAWFIRVYGLSGSGYEMHYAIKSTAGEQNNPNYAQYYQGSNETLEYIYAKNAESKIPNRKKVIMFIKDSDRNTIFELTIGQLNSPLTMMQYTDAQGNPIYPNILGTWNNAKSEYENIQNIIGLEGNSNLSGLEHELIQRFKLWQMTSNGIFPLPDNFELSSIDKTPPLILKDKGYLQLNQKYQHYVEFTDLEVYAQDPQYTISSILTPSETTSNAHKGHLCVLVSSNPDLNTDDKLVEAFEAGDEDVTIFYIVPPKATIKEYIESLHNQHLINLGQNIPSTPIGNAFSAYRIFQNLQANGLLNKYLSGDSLTGVTKILNELDEIESKWKQSSINFSGEVLFNGFTDKQLYEYYLQVFRDSNNKEEQARREVRILEQRVYLDKSAQGYIFGQVSKSITQALENALTNIFWQSSTMSPTLEKTDRHSLINDIDSDAKYEMYYTATKSKESVGSFIKILTSSTNKYSMPGIGGNKKFQINGKIDPPMFDLNFSLSYITQSQFPWSTQNINKKHVTKYFYLDVTNPDKPVWKLTDEGKKFEQEYLNKKQQRQVSVVDDIKTHYKNWERYLSFNLLDPSKTKEENLTILAQEYNKGSDNLGFVYQGELYIFKIPAIQTNHKPSSITDITEPIYLQSSELELYINAEQDADGHIIQLNISRIEYDYIQTGGLDFYGLQEPNWENFNKDLIEFNKTAGYNKKCPWLSNIKSLEELENAFKDYKEDDEGDWYFNGQIVDIELFNTQLNRLKEILPKHAELIEKLQNNLTSLLNGNINLQLEDEIADNSNTYQIVSINPDFVQVREYSPLEEQYVDPVIDIPIQNLDKFRKIKNICSSEIQKLIAR